MNKWIFMSELVNVEKKKHFYFKNIQFEQCYLTNQSKNQNFSSSYSILVGLVHQSTSKYIALVL